MFYQGPTNNLASDDFTEALIRGFWRHIRNWLTHQPNALLSFNDVREQLPLKGQHDAGLQVVPIDGIIGSEGRWREFDGAFFPRELANAERWNSINQAYN
jgi:hypothetical protein